MFKNIFTRLLVTYLVIMILVIASLSFLISSVYRGYIFEDKRKSLESAAMKAADMTKDYLNDKINQNELNAYINAMGYITDSMIYVLKFDKNKIPENKKLQVSGLKDRFITEDIIKVLNGDTVYRQKQYSTDFEMNVVFTGYPLKFNNAVNGAVLLFCPLDNINYKISKINWIIWISAAIAFLFSIPFIYFNSMRISRPIKEMETAARKIASGEKAESTKLKSNDEIRRLSESFNYMKEQIEKTEMIRRELIANISHELRTPLTSINGFAQSMIDGIVKPEEYDYYLRIIKEESGRLIKLTSEILELAKIQSGNIDLKIENIEITEAVGTVIKVMEPKAFEKSINIVNNSGKDIWVQADMERLKQILINILDNAIQYTESGGMIAVSAAKEESQVRISISDNGIGVSKDDLPFIFDKFYRARKTGRSREGSMGLGLNIVKNLVLLHNGKIWAESEEGAGTTVHFTLPLSK